MDLASWKAIWVPRSVCMNFSQTWTSDTGETFDFAAMSDESLVMAESERAEAIWLRQIECTRAEFISQAFAKPDIAQYLRGKVTELNETYALGTRNLAIPTDDVETLANFWFLRELAKRDLYYLAKHILGYDKLRFHLHKFMAESVQDIGPGYRGLREFPRDAYKTTVMGISFCVQRILRNPNVHILYKMNAGDNASLKVGEVRGRFLECEPLKALFPEHVAIKLAEEGTDHRWTSPGDRSPQKEATITSAGVGSTKGGTSQHYDIILGDDFWSEKSVTNAEQTDKVKKEMVGVEHTLAEPATGILLYIGTRFAHDDPTQELVDNPVFHCIIASGVTPTGRTIFPEALTLKHMVGQSRNSYDFSCQVMLNPTDESQGLDDKMVNWGSFQDVISLSHQGKAAFRTVILADSVGDGKKESDPIAVEVWSIDQLGRCWMRDYIREKMQPSEYVHTLFRMWGKHRPEFIVRQKTLLDTTIQSFVREKMASRSADGLDNPRFYEYSLKKREKKMRITASLQPLLADGRIWIDRDCPYQQEWINELKQHPKSQNDDGLDAAAMLDDPVVSRRPHFKGVSEPAPVPEHNEATVAVAEMTARQQNARRLFELARNRSKRKPNAWRIG